jgi:hypothetical protein
MPSGCPECCPMTVTLRNATLAGIGLMLLTVTLFSLNDAVGKWLVAAYPVGEALLIRSLVALVLVAPFVWRGGLSAFTAAPRPCLQLLRAVISTTEVVCFFWSVGYLPLARRDHVLSGGADLRHRARAVRARRARGLAPLGGGAGRLWRRGAGAQAVGGGAHRAGAGRACRQPAIRGAAHPHARAAHHRERRAGVEPDRHHRPVRPRHRGRSAG